MVNNAEKKRKRLAPYVPPSVLSEFFDHIRYVKTPEKVDSNLLQDYGTPKGHSFALLSTLKFLGLTEDDGTITPAFRALQTGGDEFQNNLSDILQNAYSDVFSRLDVTRDSRDKILNFFSRNYSPATSERATRLFLDLCGEAGIQTAASVKGKTKQDSPKVSRPRKQQPASEIPTESDIKDSEGTTKQDNYSSFPGMNIKIDSKDLVSMNPDQINALFDGLSKITKLRERIEEQDNDDK